MLYMSTTSMQAAMCRVGAVGDAWLGGHRGGGGGGVGGYMHL